MVFRTISCCRFAEKSRSLASGRFKEGRIAGCSFIEDAKQRHQARLETLDKKLEDADRSRKSPNCSHSSTLPILGRLSERVLSSNCRFVQVGSSVNGLSSDDSDIDLVFFPTDVERRRSFMKDFHGNGDFKMTIITVMSKIITRELESFGIRVRSSVVLHQLRVPLLIIHLENGQSIDIQFPEESFQAIRNTNLIRHYVQCDHRLPRLFLYFRALFNAMEIRNSKYGLLSSYHILLLIVHFLQSEQSLSPWPVLPVYAKHMGISLNPIDWCSHNHMPTAELILRFVDYYSTFDASQHVIHIEKGVTTRRKQVSGDIHLLLIDPYSKVTVCRSSAAARAFSDSMNYLKRKMANGYFLDTFPTFPEASLFKTQTKWLPWRQYFREKKAVVDKREVGQMEQLQRSQEL
ncbi:hypothetical protein KIN20_016051 [Parelaphostrongylus tenuis]|uniref:Poly(A) RNA polymerase mitochondrial-like central palm domain-containing protein n=1 Tax=Parelaphostrongylus tenuis TaxID=148309 RepID=A0AAD5N0Y9_PARTN|nr:hypothetical protein KIN20_016051 [Parelaphostrongylus tenuis]